MNTVYDTMIELAKEHKKIRRVDKKASGYTDMFKFDLDRKTIFNGFTYIYKDGRLFTDRIVLTDGTEYVFEGKPLIDGEVDFYAEMEKKYREFAYSVPTKYDNACRTNFLAKHADELSFEQIRKGKRRPEARYALEGFVMFMAMCGKIEWAERHFFWQSRNEPSLILFREWARKE